MLEHCRGLWKKLIEPIAKACVSMHLSANAITVTGSILAIGLSILIGVTGNIIPLVFLLALVVMFVSLDGSVAMLTNGGTKFGAFLDSTLDRIADWAVLIGCILIFYLHHGWWTKNALRGDMVSEVGIACALVGIMTSFVTSYARARAESVGYEAKNGIATRADRLCIILVGMLITGLTHQGAWLAIAMVLLAVLGLITVFQRIFEVRRQMRGNTVPVGDANAPEHDTVR